MLKKAFGSVLKFDFSHPFASHILPRIIFQAVRESISSNFFMHYWLHIEWIHKSEFQTQFNIDLINIMSYKHLGLCLLVIVFKIINQNSYKLKYEYKAMYLKLWILQKFCWDQYLYPIYTLWLQGRPNNLIISNSYQNNKWIPRIRRKWGKGRRSKS